ncbi:MAG TPA: hypothetical protein VMU73_01505 [Gaiellaceae bacterium]|nr:hypothetical protein [Gaiellaceae bacterium]
MGVTAHLRGIVIAGGLAALALALGFVTLLMNQTASQASVHTVLPLKARHHTRSTSAVKVPAARPVRRPDPNVVAALQAGLPRSVAKALADAPVAVVELTSKEDPVAQLALGEAKAGAALAGASFVSVDVDQNGGDVQTLTRLLKQLPTAPAALIYERPGTLYVTLPGFNDRTTVQQAAENATPAPAPTVAHVLTSVPDWATRASVLCRQAYARIGALGGSGSPAKLATHKSQFDAAGAGFLAQMKALTPAAGKGAQVAQLNALLARNFAAEDAMVVAATSHNVGALAAARTRAAGYQPKIAQLERKLGASGCVEGAA